jgi:N-acetylglucosamine transport system permease protein
VGLTKLKKYQLKIFIGFCTLPALILYGVFALYPFMQSILMSFYSWSGVSDKKKFIGFDNFLSLMQDRILFIALENNLIILVIVPLLTLIFSLGFAILLTRIKLREKQLYRTVFFFPNVLASAIVAIIWLFIYNPTFGFLNSFLTMIGLESWTRVWLGDPSTALISVAMPMIWQSIGFYMIIYIAAIEGIPNDLYEVAKIDGASEVEQLRFITIPLIWQIIQTTLLFSLIGVFNGGIAYIMLMTAGGPNNSSNILMSYLYQQAFYNSNFGYAMAISVFIIIILIFLSYIIKKFTEREAVEY